jgi:hypothetical protein
MDSSNLYVFADGPRPQRRSWTKMGFTRYLCDKWVQRTGRRGRPRNYLWSFCRTEFKKATGIDLAKGQAVKITLEVVDE